MNSLKYCAARLLPFFIFFVALAFCVRASLIVYSWEDIAATGLPVPVAFLIGLGFDIAAFFYIAIPVMLYALCIPQRFQGTKRDALLTALLFFIFSYVLLFSATGEWLFWDEFQTRYNFIAVDYLVYTNEVIGNIRESYPVGLLMSMMTIIAAALSYAIYTISLRALPVSVALRTRFTAMAILLMACVISFFAMHANYAKFTQNRYLNEIARNGIYELFSAFRHNDLQYDDFYIQKPIEDIAAFVAKTTGGKASAESPLTRTVKGKKIKPYNLVIVTVESLSADFLGTFGETHNLTPNLDKLVDQSLFFSNLYATGTRTVYGLSAITLGIPPIPGNAIVRRAENGDMFSIGSVLKSKGYETKFIYGGFGYFDNMNDFFAANGYAITDRNDFSDEEINFANIWGVADDDLFRRVMKEGDKSHAQGKPFFSMVMTTSNHRPYTFPDGKIDLPSKTSGRWGGVKFTDFAIGEFLQEAKKHPWFDNTIFVIVSDHTAGSSGRSELEPQKYHIPMWIYAPGIIKPGKVDWMASQIDVPPTILGLMGMSYESKFYGKDLMREKPERAFISNYQQLGYITDDGLVILKPVDEASFYIKDESGQYTLQKDMDKAMLDDAVGYYQGASQWRTWSREK